VRVPSRLTPDELDVAVDLVVAATDESRLAKATEAAIDQGSRPMIVDREQDDVPLAKNIADVGLVEVDRNRLAGETCLADPAGERLGLVGADGGYRELLTKRVDGLEDVAVDEHEQRLAGGMSQIPDKWRQQLGAFGWRSTSGASSHWTRAFAVSPCSGSLLSPNAYKIVELQLAAQPMPSAGWPS